MGVGNTRAGRRVAVYLPRLCAGWMGEELVGAWKAVRRETSVGKQAPWRFQKVGLGLRERGGVRLHASYGSADALGGKRYAGAGGLQDTCGFRGFHFVALGAGCWL